MNVKKAVQYQTHKMIKEAGVYYGILYAITILLVIIMGRYLGGIAGLEALSLTFVFIIILTSFKDTFKMFLQNGLSRGTFFKSFILSIIQLSIFMSLMDSIYGIIINIFSNYESMYFQIYERRFVAGSSELVKLTEGFLWHLFTYLSVAMIAYFLAVLYYRMDKKITIIVSVGLPMFFMIILPIIDLNFANHAISNAIAKFIYFSSGFNNGYNPYYYMVTSIVTFVIFGGLSYGLIKKATVKV